MRRGHAGALGNPPHALAPLAREVIYLGQLVSIVQGRSDCAAWLEHSNPTARVLMNEEQRCCFPERDRGQRKGTRTGIHPGLYLATCDQRPPHPRAVRLPITGLFSHHSPLTVSLAPASFLQRGKESERAWPFNSKWGHLMNIPLLTS